jgi:hypothetical protein
VNDPFGQHGGQYVNNYSEAENRAFAERFSLITESFAKAMQAGISPATEEVQQLVQAHYEFCLQFWKPSREAYKSLSLSYLLPSPYRDAYEAVASGLGKYHYDAIVIWADANL